MPYRSLLSSASSIVALSALAIFANATSASAYEYCRPRCHWVYARMQL
jgi:hypothetical protein